MFAQVINGVIVQLIQPGVQWTYEGVTYPGNWIQLAGPGELAALGIVNVVYGQRPNDQYYWVTQETPVYNAQANQVDINFTSTPKDLVTIKSTATNNINQQAYTLLQPSDWMVIRSTESGGVYPVPQAWNTWRATIRTQAATAANAVTASTDVDQVAAVFPIAWANNPDTPAQGA